MTACKIFKEEQTMKTFLEEYGFVILIAVVVIMLVVIASPIGETIKTSVSGLVDGFGNKTVAKIDKTDKEVNLTLNGSILTIESISETDKYVAILRGYQGGKEVSVASVGDRLTCTDSMSNTATFADATGFAETTSGIAKFIIENGTKLDENAEYYIEIMNIGTGEIFKSNVEILDDDLILSTEPNPYTDIVADVQKLYDVGEANLTDDDIVTVNGIDCYVLQADDSKAQLITKDIYNARFDTGGHTSEEVEGHIGTGGGYTDKTYDYKYSTLRTWMNNFYVNKLGADSKILPTTVTYYTKDTQDNNLDSYAVGTIAGQYVFVLDAKDAKQYADKFGWNSYIKQKNDDGSLSDNNSYYFWTAAGYYGGWGFSGAWMVSNNGSASRGYGVTHTFVGARPAFWISLE